MKKVISRRCLRECKVQHPSVQLDPVQPASTYLTREFCCLYPDQDCPLCAVLLYFSKNEKGLSEYLKRVHDSRSGKRYCAASPKTSQEKHSTSRQWTTHDKDTRMEVSRQSSSRDVASVCRLYDCCSFAVIDLLSRKIASNHHPSSASIMVTIGTVAPDGGK